MRLGFFFRRSLVLLSHWLTAGEPPASWLTAVAAGERGCAARAPAVGGEPDENGDEERAELEPSLAVW